MYFRLRKAGDVARIHYIGFWWKRRNTDFLPTGENLCEKEIGRKQKQEKDGRKNLPFGPVRNLSFIVADSVLGR